MRILGFIVLVVLILPACKHECRKVVDTYNDGKDKVVHEIPDCSDSTTYTRLYYHENGQLASQAQYVNGVTNGKCKSWYENGVMSAEWEQLNGKQDGPFRCWEENGVLYKQGTTRDGLEHGLIKEWDKNGKLIYEANLIDGKRDGVTTSYNSTGKFVRMYKHGLLEGNSYESFYDSTDKERRIVIGQFRNDKEEGMWKWFHEDSMLYFTEEYKEGQAHGKAIKYFLDGSIQRIGQYEFGREQGDWQYYNDKGKLIGVEVYKDGNLVLEKYYEQGKLIRTKKI
jgi:antitoxin component YwqK of YwqJK toxin-antitoxin module